MKRRVSSIDKSGGQWTVSSPCATANSDPLDSLPNERTRLRKTPCAGIKEAVNLICPFIHV